MRLFVLLCLLSLILGAAANPCAPGALYNADLDICYAFVASPLGFIAAEQICVLQRGHLTSVWSAFDNNDIATQAANNFTATSSFWIGGSDLYSQEDWMWMDWRKMVYARWGAGEPRIQDGQCVAMDSETREWSVHDCTTAKPFVCETPGYGSTVRPNTQPAYPTTRRWDTTTDGTTQLMETTITATSTPSITPPTAPTPPHSYSQCPQDYTYSSVTGYCYKRTFESLSFSAAEASCVVDGGHLASIHSQREQTVVQDLIRLYTFRSFTWLGLQFVNATSRWGWSDGTPVDYAPANTNLPPTKGFCMELVQLSASSWQWYPVSCGTSIMYMCKTVANPK